MRKLNILVVGGHPADVFDHCGGTLAHHAAKGDHVTAVALTQGLRIHDVVISEILRFSDKKPEGKELDALLEERTRVKHQEVIDACGLLGIYDVRFISYHDKYLLVTEAMVENVARIIREVRPDIIVTHYPLENAGIASHHGVTGQIVLHAAGYAGMVDYEDKNLSHRVAQIYFMAPLEATFKSTFLSGVTPVYCDHYVDITDVVEKKVRALSLMKSQQYDGLYAKKVIECWNGKDGHYMTVGYAEGFVRYLPEISDGLTISDRRLAWENEAEKETRLRSTVFTVPGISL
jgi:LmbE family N-acetylglucosaminyl deacetylase